MVHFGAFLNTKLGGVWVWRGQVFRILELSFEQKEQQEHEQQQQQQEEKVAKIILF